MNPTTPTNRKLVTADTDGEMSIDQILEMGLKTATSIMRDLHHRRHQASGADIDALDKTIKTVMFLKRNQVDEAKSQDLGALLERAMKIPELRDAMAKSLQPQQPQTETDGDE